jgi:tellurium resistance protein TerD
MNIPNRQYNVVLEYSSLKDILDLSAFLLDANGKAEGNGCFAHHGNPVSGCNAVRHKSEKSKREIISVDVNSVPENIHKIVFVVTVKDGENVPECIKLANETGVCSLFVGGLEGNPLHIFDLADAGFEGGAVFYEIVRSSNGWTERVAAAGSRNTFNDFAKIYGIETKKIVLPPPVPPQQKKPEPQKTLEENVRLTQLQEENKLLQQQLQTERKHTDELKQQWQAERKRTEELQEKYNRLAKKYNHLLEQQLVNSKLLPELQMLFSESLQYHFAETPLKDALERSIRELTDAQSINAVLKIAEELYGWWSGYRIQNTVRSSFWRPDSWSRFESAFPNHPVTIKLKLFVK